MLYLCCHPITIIPNAWSSWSIEFEGVINQYEGDISYVEDGQKYPTCEVENDLLPSICESNGYQYGTSEVHKLSNNRRCYNLKCVNGESCKIAKVITSKKVFLRCLPKCKGRSYFDRSKLECIHCDTSNSDKCNCIAGSYWYFGQCKECPENTYSSSSAKNCTDCPTYSSSAAGSSKCICTAGKQTECTECQKSYPSSEDSRCNSAEQSSKTIKTTKEPISLTAIILIITSSLILIISIIGMYVYRSKITELFKVSTQ